MLILKFVETKFVKKQKNTVQEIVSTSMKLDITHIVVKIILIRLMKAGFQIKRDELYRAMTILKTILS